VSNAQARWDDFDPVAYWRHNYASLRDDDRLILTTTGDHFCRHFGAAAATGPRRGLDVGSGANLYPALAMLPWSRDLSLLDHSARNVRWLRDDLMDAADPWRWSPHWTALSHLPPYARLPEPRRALARACEVRCTSIFDLPRRAWQLGTMFFVAESITNDPQEFIRATASFLLALQHGAPFAAAFMTHSRGYQVGGVDFPAVRLDCDQIGHALREHADSLSVQHVLPGGPVLRSGYSGMALALGTVR